MQFESVLEKLKDIISTELGNKRVFDKDVAPYLNMSKENLAAHKNRNVIPYEAVAYFCAKRNISINWVLFDQLPKSLEVETEKYSKIRFYANIRASAGGGAINFDEDYEYLAVDNAFLNSLSKSSITMSYSSKNIIAMNVFGDSMVPTLNDKDIILCDTSKTNIKKEGVFVVTGSGGLFVKRISLRIDGRVELISDNKNYTTQIIDAFDENVFGIIGMVVGKVGMV